MVDNARRTNALMDARIILPINGNRTSPGSKLVVADYQIQLEQEFFFAFNCYVSHNMITFTKRT